MNTQNRVPDNFGVHQYFNHLIKYGKNVLCKNPTIDVRRLHSSVMRHCSVAIDQRYLQQQILLLEYYLQIFFQRKLFNFVD